MRSFTGSYLNEYNILSNAIIGLELEFFSKYSYPSTIEALSNRLNKKVKGITTYHPDLKPTEDCWLLTPDFSGGMNMAELITHPMPYAEARIWLMKILNIIEEIGTTTERTGLHINISFKNEDINKLNPLKLILNMDEEKVYSIFPERQENLYAKSIINLIPVILPDTNSFNIIQNSIMLYDESCRYYGINFTRQKDGWIEYRYLGGKDYTEKSEDILELMDYFIVITYDSLNNNINSDLKSKIYNIREKMRKLSTSFSSLNEFLSSYPKISLQVDTNGEYKHVKSYFLHLKSKLSDIFRMLKISGKCVINYDTQTHLIEIVNADVDINGIIKNVLFINSEISGGNIIDSDFSSCVVKDTILNSCKFNQTDIYDSKITKSEVYSSSMISECYFSEGLMDGVMKGGVFRSGKIGDNAVISEETKIMKKTEDFFGLEKKKIIDTLNIKKK